MERKDFALTENVLKKTTLKFLRRYYKFRNRADEKPLEAKTDVASEDGIIADGFMRIPLPDEKEDFIVTFEATSYDKIGEIRFRILYSRLIWDTLAVSSIIVLMLIAGLMEFGWKPLFDFPQGVFFVGVWTIIFGIWEIFRRFFSKMPRYRYIYAVEQFKKYFANEQWIAVGEDAVELLLPEELKELKNQCIYNGLGLLLVDDDLKINPLTTPSREVVIKKKRKRRTFQSITSIKLNMSLKGQLGKFSKRFLKKRKNKKGKPKANYLRFRQRLFINQFVTFFAATSFSAFLLYKDYSEPPVIYKDEDSYESVLLNKALEKFPEETHYFIDTPQIEPIKKKERPYLNVDEGGMQKRNDPIIPYQDPKVKVFFILDDHNPIEYDCSRLKNIGLGRYFLRVARFKTQKEAKDLVETLADISIYGGFFWEGCLNDSGRSFSVLIGSFYDDWNSAKAAKMEYQTVFKPERYGIKSLDIVRIY